MPASSLTLCSLFCSNHKGLHGCDQAVGSSMLDSYSESEGSQTEPQTLH